MQSISATKYVAAPSSCFSEQHVTHAVCVVLSPHSLGSGVVVPESFGGGETVASGEPASSFPGDAVSAGFVSVTVPGSFFADEHADTTARIARAHEKVREDCMVCSTRVLAVSSDRRKRRPRLISRLNPQHLGYAPPTMRLGISAAVLASTLAWNSLAAAQPRARTETVAVPPVRGTVTEDEGRRLTTLIRDQVDAAGFQALRVDRPELSGDALLETVVVSDPNGCFVKTSVKSARGAAGEATATCDGTPGMPMNAQVRIAVSRSVQNALATLPSPGTAQVVPVPTPLPDPPPVEPTPAESNPVATDPTSTPVVEPTGPNDAYVFEPGVNLKTRTFYGLGHMVLGEDDTERFYGVFSLTAAHNDMGRFHGVLQLAFGHNETKHFVGGASFGFFNTTKEHFSGLAYVALGKNEGERMIGVVQATPGLTKMKSFGGVVQVSGAQLTKEFIGIAQVGGLTATKAFAGVVQAGGVAYSGKEFGGALQAGVATYVYKGKLHAIAQAATVNFVNGEVRGGAQVGAANLYGQMRGGAQIGVVNLIGTKDLGTLWSRHEERESPSFQGGIQVSTWNALDGSFEGGAQLAGFNFTKGNFSGVLQAGAMNLDEHDFAGVFQLGAVNVVYDAFAGVAQIGVLDFAEKVQAAQIGGFNNGGDVRGAQIGVFNSARTLVGIQLGLVNWVRDRSFLPVVPVMNLGW